MNNQIPKLFLAVGVLALLQASTGWSQNPSAQNLELATTDESQSNEDQAISFVKLHHPELASLLEILKKSDPSKYRAAIKDVSKVVKRLEVSRKRDETLHQIEIEGWKIQSKIDLLLAKGMARDRKINESDFEQLIENRIDNQIQRTTRELELIDERRVKLAESLDKMTANRKAQIEKQVANMLKRIRTEKPKAAIPES